MIKEIYFYNFSPKFRVKCKLIYVDVWKLLVNGVCKILLSTVKIQKDFTISNLFKNKLRFIILL